MVVLDHKPAMLVEVKAGDDAFSKSLLRFHSVFEEAKAFQIVYNLKKAKSKEGIARLSAHEFLLAYSCKRRHPGLRWGKLLSILSSEAGGGVWGMAL